MLVTSLALSHFRSYVKTTHSFHPQLTLITGPNTAGKTNILEALYLIATGKSFRAERDGDMITWGNNIGRAKLVSGDDSLEVLLTHGDVDGNKTQMKKYKVNGVPRRLLDFLGHFRAVLFWPEDLTIVTDSPSKRRRYLDSILVQTDREYRRNLLSYERGLRQRNKLLDLICEGSATRSQLLFWNQLLIKTGGYITDTRSGYLDFLNAVDSTSYTYRSVYDKSVISESRLLEYKDAEIGARVTLVGPHRDDFAIEIQSSGVDGFRDVGSFGSRGQQRLAVLWLKQAEVLYMTRQAQNRPVLLLDDIFSELDGGHRREVMSLLKVGQTILTSAEEEAMDFLATRGRETFSTIRLGIE